MSRFLSVGIHSMITSLEATTLSSVIKVVSQYENWMWGSCLGENRLADTGGITPEKYHHRLGLFLHPPLDKCRRPLQEMWLPSEQTFGSDLTQPLSRLTTHTDFSSVGKSCRQAKQASCAHCPHLSPSLPPSSAIFEDRDLEVFVLATFLYVPHEGDRFCLAPKGYHSWKHWGRRTSGQ